MATLTVTHTESLNLNGADRGSTKSLIIDSVTTVYETVFPLSSTDTNILQLDALSEGGSSFKLDVASIKYMRFTNLDATNNIHLAFGTAAGSGNHFTIVIKPLETFLTSGPDNYMGTVTGGTLTYSFADLLSINAKTETANTTASLEVFAAGV
jgi:hypothetical protein